MTPLLAGFLCLSQATEQPFRFRDVSKDVGLYPHLQGMRGHSGAWGDVDGDGWIDLYVGTFFQKGSKSNRFLRNKGGRFTLDGQEAMRTEGAASGSVFADFDNDGDLDFFLANLAKGREGPTSNPSFLWRNDGNGKFTDVSRTSGACPAGFKGRSATVLDFDGDGLLDLLAGEGVSYGSRKNSRLYRNLGNLRFEDATRAAGLPDGLPGMGVAAADVTGDGWPDIYLAARGGGNRLYINDGKGAFREADHLRELFSWTYTNGDDNVCGAAFGDINGDGRVDLLVGQHFDHPWRKPVPVRVYLNRGLRDGKPVFEEITKAAGLDPLAMKAPHVEIQDFDNDGRADIYVSIVKFAGGRPHPMIYRNLGTRDGVPRFANTAWTVNDFPTDKDRALKRSRDFYAKMVSDRKISYYAPGPSGDFDNDGRLDLLLVSWWMEEGTLLLRNETKAGNWLQVRVRGRNGVNRMGIGSVVHIYPAGKVGKPSARIGTREISAAYGYSSGQDARAHFGLGSVKSCDVEVVLPHGMGRIMRQGVEANQLLELEQEQ